MVLKRRCHLCRVGKFNFLTKNPRNLNHSGILNKKHCKTYSLRTGVQSVISEQVIVSEWKFFRSRSYSFGKFLCLHCSLECMGSSAKGVFGKGIVWENCGRDVLAERFQWSGLFPFRDSEFSELFEPRCREIQGGAVTEILFPIGTAFRADSPLFGERLPISVLFGPIVQCSNVNTVSTLMMPKHWVSLWLCHKWKRVLC